MSLASLCNQLLYPLVFLARSWPQAGRLAGVQRVCLSCAQALPLSPPLACLPASPSEAMVVGCSPAAAPNAMDVDDDNDLPALGGRLRAATKEELPNSIMVTGVPDEVFSDPQAKANFSQLFTQIEEDIHFDFFKSFRRVRVVFSTPEQATAAKLIVQHHQFNGTQMKAYFAQRVLLSRHAEPSVSLLCPPPLEKQFLISPPSSPPVGWEQTHEMAPVVCSFDLMARLAAFTMEDQYEVHEGTDEHPKIIVHPCDTPVETPPQVLMPHTPRPPISS